MCFSELQVEDNKQFLSKIKLNWSMYVPQIVLLIIVFVIGLYIPSYLIGLIKLTVVDF